MPKMSKHTLMLTVLPLLLCACATTAPQPAWVKSRATAQEFYQAKDQCLQDAQRRESYADAGEVVITDWDHFSACLNSQGWSLQRVARN